MVTNRTISTNYDDYSAEYVQIVNWIFQFCCDGSDLLRQNQTNNDGKVQYFCGLPSEVPCCDKNQAAERYLPYKGIIYGLCPQAAKVFGELLRELREELEIGGLKDRALQEKVKTLKHADRDKLNRLNSSDNPEKLFYVLAAQVKEINMLNWVDLFALKRSVKTPTPILNSAGQHLCGLPKFLQCCDHTRPVGKYAILGGRAYGMCKYGVWAFAQWQRMNGRVERLTFSAIEGKAKRERV